MRNGCAVGDGVGVGKDIGAYDMVLIVGGREQGRLAYALSEFGCTEEDVFDCTVRLPEVRIMERVIYKADELIRHIGIDEFLSQYRETLCDKIIITTETGCGLVPISAEDRMLRERVGRANCMLAALADRVDRVVCGIGMTIKGV